MADRNADTAAKARATGTEFYKLGQFAKAKKAYQIAASLAPQDPAPVSNLSAVKYEIGDYNGSITHIKQALALGAAGTEDSAKTDKLNARLAKCFLHLRDFGSATDAISTIGNQDLAAELAESLESVLALQADAPEESILRRQILDHVPQYKSWLANVVEYYPYGHDQVEIFMEPIGIDATTNEVRDVSMLFAGSGDARNVFTAITSMSAREDGQTRTFGNLHITMLDLNRAALAKTLILFNMMYQIDNEMDEQGQHPTDYFLTMAYVFACQIIPPFVQSKLQNSIEDLIKRLVGEQEMLPFVYLSDGDKKAIVRVLRQWQKPWPAISTPAHLRKLVKRNTPPNNSMDGLPFGSGKEKDTPEKKDFKKFTALFPSEAEVKQWEPALSDALAEYRKTGKSEKLLQQIDSTWAVNNTAIDYDYAEFGVRTGDGSGPYLEFNPLETVESMDFQATTRRSKKVDRSEKAIDRLANIFRIHGISAIRMNYRKWLTVEIIAGEMTDIMERIRYNALDHRRVGSENSTEKRLIDPKTFPQTYDFVHLSNIPDYIGGHLSTFLVVRPLLNEDSPSCIRFNNLLNPPEFESHEAFQSEYLLMHDREQIRKHFHVARRVAPPNPRDEMIKQMMGGMMSPFAFEGDMTWTRQLKAQMTYKELLPRAAFEKWMHGHLLKICLPYPRPIFSSSPVYAPLNLTTLIRLMISMFEVGYPAHWLLRVFSQICSGTLTTTARPPTERVTNPAAADAKHHPKEISVGPWVDEFTTLLSIWRALIPFGVDSLGGALVPLTGINQYSIDFPPFRTEHERLPHFILLFWNTEIGYTLKPPGSIRYVLSGAYDGTSTHALSKALLDKAIVCVTAFQYLAGSRTAVFSMRADKMEKMKTGKWRAFIWRTDAWEAVTDGVDVSAEVVTRKNWAAMA